MDRTEIVEQLVATALSGDRRAVRALLERALRAGRSAREVLDEIVGDAVDLLVQLEQRDLASGLALGLAAGALRGGLDAVPIGPTPPAPVGRVLVVAGREPLAEAAVEAIARSLEGDGFDVRLALGGVPADEVALLAGELQPRAIVLFGIAREEATSLASLLQVFRELDGSGRVILLAGGGLLNRAEGLADFIGADEWVRDGYEAAEAVRRLVAPAAAVAAAPARRDSENPRAGREA